MSGSSLNPLFAYILSKLVSFKLEGLADFTFSFQGLKPPLTD
jgi:hypothetical protein